MGRLVGRPWRIELGPRAMAGEKRLREVVTDVAAYGGVAGIPQQWLALVEPIPAS